MADLGGVLSSLAGAAWRRFGPASLVGGNGRTDGAGATLQAPTVAQAQHVAATRTDASDARTDCGPGGGCGPAPGWGTDDYGPLGWGYVGLSRQTIDTICTEQLMYTIVAALVDDATVDTPTLAGETVGEATDCVEWLAERGYYEAQHQALFYSRQYGGGGVVCVIDDGRPPEEEVDVTAVRDVLGFYALPKWYLVPADAGSSRVRAGWYGQRLGRPERYWMTPVVPPDLTSLAGVAPADAAAERDRAILGAGGALYHRSRVIPWPYRSDLDLRQARQFAYWSGWGPGVVEGCIAAYMARRTGVLRTDTIMASSHFNVLTAPNISHALSTPDGGQGIRNIIQWVVDCLAESGKGTLPFTVVEKGSTLEAKSHTLAGISDILREQRAFLLDCLPEYIEPRIFGAGGNGGMSGDSGQTGLWRTYYGNVAQFQRSTIWTAGKFGGGQQQAVRLSMLVPDGPTAGVLDLTVKPTWPNLWEEGGEATAKTRLLNAQARAIDRTTLGLTPAAMLRHDKTLAGSDTATYASLDVDDGPLPELASQSQGPAGAPDGAAPNALEAAPPTGATTPAAAVSAINEVEQQAAAPAAVPLPSKPTEDAASPVVGGVTMGADFEAAAPAAGGATSAPTEQDFALPADIITEVQAAKMLKMTRAAFRKWALARGVQVYPVDKGTRGGHRYSGSAVLAAWHDSAKARLDAALAR